MILHIFLGWVEIEKQHSKLIRLYSIRSLKSLKFIYSEKATKVFKNGPIFFDIAVTLKKVGIFFQIFLAFSEYMNFTCNAVNILASVFQFNDKTMDPNFPGACFIDLELDRKPKLVKNKSRFLST